MLLTLLLQVSMCSRVLQRARKVLVWLLHRYRVLRIDGVLGSEQVINCTTAEQSQAVYFQLQQWTSGSLSRLSSKTVPTF